MPRRRRPPRVLAAASVVLTLLSLLLFLAVLVLWVRSGQSELSPDLDINGGAVRVYRCDAVVLARGRTYYAWSFRGRVGAGVMTQWRGDGGTPIDLSAPPAPYADRWTVSWRLPFPPIRQAAYFGYWEPGSSTLGGGSHTKGEERGAEVWCPHAALAAALAVPPVAWFVRRAGRRLVARLRRGAGHCPSCGYDLTANASGRCPECGDDIPAAAAEPRA